MNDLLRWRDEHHMLPLLLAASVIVLLAIAAAALWSGGDIAEEARFASLRGIRGAYDRVVPGRTSQPQLARMGFDPARLKARALSGLGVQEFFMPRTAAAFDQLDPAIQACFDGPDRCSALVFPLATPAAQTGFMSAHAAPAVQKHIVFLLRNGRVAYKAME